MRRLSICLLLLLIAGGANAEPMALGNPEPRRVHVRFENSPASQPSRLASVFTEPLPAWLEPGEREGQVKVTVPADVVEQHLLADQRPKRGSFGDFVWIFDVESGRVISAQLSGTLMKRLNWGLFQSDVEAPIFVEMGTAADAGYRRPHRLLGQELYGYCERADRLGCTLVEPAHYDEGTGYVNAVGVLAVRFGISTIRTFSPLGEAVFSEDPAAAADKVTASIPHGR